jgi:hypothetical protein
MNYQDVETFQELGEAIEKYIDRHKVPCQDSITGEASMQLFTSPSTDDARLAFIRLKNKFGLETPVPKSLIELLDSCGDADRKLQAKSESEKPADTITLLVAVKEYGVSRSTLKRRIGKGEIKSYRKQNASKNSPHLIRRTEIEQYYNKRNSG